MTRRGFSLQDTPSSTEEGEGKTFADLTDDEKLALQTNDPAAYEVMSKGRRAKAPFSFFLWS
jgi:hypothetical protein